MARLSRKISISEVIPSGWIKGRIVSKDSFLKKHQNKETRRAVSQRKEKDKIKRLKEILVYYEKNDIPLRDLCKKFKLGHNAYKTFERYFPEEYKRIVKDKPMNSNTTKGRYKDS
jgi:hypothetical protein